MISFGNIDIYVSILAQMGTERLIETAEAFKTPEEFFQEYPPATDFDGVVCDLRTHVVSEFNRRYGTNYTTFDIRSYHQVFSWAKGLGKSSDEALEIANDLWYNPDLLSSAEPVRGADRWLGWFVDRNISIPIITARRPDLRDVTLEWLDQKMEWFPKDDVYLRPVTMQDMSGDVFKAYMINMLNRGIFFEDIWEQARFVLDNTNSMVVLLSNLRIIDNYDQERLVRIPETIGVGPDMDPVYKLFMNKK